MLFAVVPLAYSLGASFACSAAFALRSTDNFLVNGMLPSVGWGRKGLEGVEGVEWT